PHAIAATGEQSRVVTAAGAGHGHARGAGPVDRGEAAARLQPRGQGRRRRAQLPAVAAPGVDLLPERRRAHRRAIELHSSPSKSAMVVSAPAPRSSASVWAVVTPTARMPAVRAASTPTSESSKTTHTAGGTPRRRAASRYTSGLGLPSFTSS